MTAADRLAAALGYAARDWLVVPLHDAVTFGPKTGADRARCSCGRLDCESQGKHPRPKAWQKAATTDPETIRAWWAKWPMANIGIATGHAVDVLDLDGDQALDALDAATPAGAGALDGPIVTTGRGCHIYVASTGDLPNRSGIRGMPSCDWRGHNGQVVAPPSVHHTGVQYQWGPDHGPDRPLRPCPAWLHAVVADENPTPRGVRPPCPAGGLSRYAEQALNGEIGRVARAPVGGRNDSLNRAAFALGQLVAGGELDERTVIGELMSAAERVGLTGAEAKATIASGLGKGAASPRKAKA